MEGVGKALKKGRSAYSSTSKEPSNRKERTKLKEKLCHDTLFCLAGQSCFSLTYCSWVLLFLCCMWLGWPRHHPPAIAWSSARPYAVLIVLGMSRIGIAFLATVLTQTMLERQAISPPRNALVTIMANLPCSLVGMRWVW